MSFAHLPTLAEIQAQRCAKPKPDRLAEKTVKVKDDKAQLEKWKAEVRRRDRMRCRVCKRKVVVTMELTPNRAECHHIRGRAHKPTRYDRRNGLLCCLTCHRKFKNGLVVYGQQQDMFVIDGERYINADFALEFK